MSNITQLTTVPADLGRRPGHAAGSGDDETLALQAPGFEDGRPRRLRRTPASPSNVVIISEGATTGVYVYTILDLGDRRGAGADSARGSGPHQAARPDYTAGQVLDTKV